MITWIFLIGLLMIRLLVRPFYFSPLNFIILLAYLVTLVGIIGRVRWGLYWTWGASLGAILAFFLFNEGEFYTLILDFILLFIGILAFFIEKKLKG